MKKHTLLAATLLASTVASSASAEGLSFGVDFALGAWANHSTQIGLASKQDRVTGKLGLSVANDFGMFTGQMDLNFQTLTRPSDGDEDATQGLVDATLRAMRDFGGVRAGLFLGKGEHEDFGDSNQYMSYQFAGIDAEKEMGFGTVFGQFGYLDSADEYDEGIRRATFLRIGAEYQLGSDIALTGALSMARGRGVWDGDDKPAKVLGIELGVEKALGDSGMTLYGSYEHTSLITDNNGEDYGDEFGTLWVGLKYDFGGDNSRGRKLPNLGQWVAYYANEIE